jgi:hypothetical protein
MHACLHIADRYCSCCCYCKCKDFAEVVILLYNSVFFVLSQTKRALCAPHHVCNKAVCFLLLSCMSCCLAVRCDSLRRGWSLQVRLKRAEEDTKVTGELQSHLPRWVLLCCQPAGLSQAESSIGKDKCLPAILLPNAVHVGTWHAMHVNSDCSTIW